MLNLRAAQFERQKHVVLTLEKKTLSKSRFLVWPMNFRQSLIRGRLRVPLGLARTIPVMLFGFLFLVTSCSTPNPPPAFSNNPEAQEIHNDLVDAGFIDEELSSTFGTGLGGNGSGVIRFLRLLTNAESEEERMPIRQDLSRELAPLGFSAICFRTPTAGATVRYKALHQDFVEHGPQTNRSDSHLMPLGFYHIWTERGGSATTTEKSLFRITRRSQRINLEVGMGDTSGLEDCNVE